MDNSTLVGAEILYQSPKVRRRALSSYAPTLDDMTYSGCTLTEGNTRSNNAVCCYCEGEANRERRSDYYPERSGSRYCRQKENDSNYCNYHNAGISCDRVEIICPECVNEASRNEFWKKYDNVDEVPVKDVSYEGNQCDVRECLLSRTNDIQIEAPVIPKASRNNADVDAKPESEILDLANKLFSSVLVECEKGMKNIDTNSIELQTDESALETDQASEDFFNALVKNILDKFLIGKNDVQKYYKNKCEQFLLSNRDKCRCAVEKVIQNMIQELKIQDSTDSNESISKEEEIASFNYKGDCTTDTDNFAISTTSIKEIKTISNEPGQCNFGNNRKIMITTETTIRKEIQMPKAHSQEIEKNILSTDNVQKLLMKCLAVGKSDCNCKLENSISNGTSTFNAEAGCKADVDAKSGMLKQIAINVEPNSKDITPAKILDQTATEDELSRFKGEKDLENLIERDCENAIKAFVERKCLSDNSIKRSIFEMTSNLDERLKGRAQRREVFSASKIVTKHESALDDISKCSKSRIPVKSSDAKNDLRCDDSEMKTKSTDFERRGLLAKICFFICKTFCKN